MTQDNSDQAIEDIDWSFPDIPLQVSAIQDTAFDVDTNEILTCSICGQTGYKHEFPCSQDGCPIC